MTHTRGNYSRAESHYTAEPLKSEVLRLWALHTKTRDIARRTGLSVSKCGDIIRNALADGEAEEIRVIYDGEQATG